MTAAAVLLMSVLAMPFASSTPVAVAAEAGEGSIHVHLAWPTLAPNAAVVRIDWTLPSGASPASIEIEKRIDDGRFYRETITPGSVASISRALAFGPTYQFRVRGLSASGAAGPWVTGSRFRLALADIGCSQATAPPCVIYEGVWTVSRVPGALGGIVFHTDEPGSFVRARTAGGELAFVSVTGPDRGIVEMVLDGVRVGFVDLYSPTVQPKRPVFIARDLAGRQLRCEGDVCFTNELLVRHAGQKNPASTGTRIDVDTFVELTVVP